MWADVWVDAERVAVDYLLAQVPLFPGGLQGATVGVALPAGWTTAAAPHLAVSLDYDTDYAAWGGWQTRNRATIRVTAWADTPTRVKRLARLARTALLAFPARPNTGLIVTRDPDNLAPTASFSAHINTARNP